MSREVIEEYLEVARLSVSTQKPAGGVYGYPAVLLLFSVAEALSRYRAGNAFQLVVEIFPHLTDGQIKTLREWYRHLLAHQAVIMPGGMLSPETVGNPVEVNEQGEPTLIRVVPFYNAVCDAWAKFPPEQIKPDLRQSKSPPPTNPLSSDAWVVTSTSRTATAYIDLSKKPDH
jgi:hypothetical protein